MCSGDHEEAEACVASREPRRLADKSYMNSARPCGSVCGFTSQPGTFTLLDFEMTFTSWMTDPFLRGRNVRPLLSSPVLMKLRFSGGDPRAGGRVSPEGKYNPRLIIQL